MKKLSMMLAAAFMVAGTSTFAMEMSGGKCGKAMQAKPMSKCGASMKKMAMQNSGKCGGMKKGAKEGNMSKEGNTSMQMGGKCGKALPAKPKGKCGVGKCGSK